MKILPCTAVLLLLLSIFNSHLSTAHAQGTAFSYQGNLNVSGNSANGLYDVRFTVSDALTNGNTIAGPITNSATAVSNGLFSVTLDFGSGVFTGPARWLQLDVRTNGSGAFIPLSPRQPVMPVPYAIMASSASNLLGTLPTAQLIGTVPTTQLPSAVVTNNANNLTLNGTFTGSGSGLTGLNPANVNAGTAGISISGNAATATTAVNVTGSISDSQLSANIARLNGTNSFTSTNNFHGVMVATNANNIFNGTFTGNGVGLTNLNVVAAIPAAINATSITLGPTNIIAPLTVPPGVPTSAIGSVNTGGALWSVVVAGRYVYGVNTQGNTLQVFDVSTPSAPASVGSVSTGNEPISVAVAGRYGYVVSEQANTLQVFDVSDPVAPVSVGSVSTGSQPVFVAVAGRYAYVAIQGVNLLQIFDVSSPAAPVSVGSVGAGVAPQSVAVAGRYAYVVNYGTSTGTLQIFDVSNPSAAVSVGSVGAGTSPHSVVVAGRYAYVTSKNSLQVFDVSNPSAPVSVGSIATGTDTNPSFLAVAGRYAYVPNSANNILQVYDVSNPAAPLNVGSVSTGLNPWSVAVAGRYAYVVIYGSSTLAIFDLSGAYIQHLEAGAMETGTLQTRDTVNVGNNLNVLGGLTVSGSARITGGLNLGGITTNILTSSSGGHTLYITNGIIMNVQ